MEITASYLSQNSSLVNIRNFLLPEQLSRKAHMLRRLVSSAQLIKCMFMDVIYFLLACSTKLSCTSDLLL